MPQGKAFHEAPTGEWGFVESVVDDVAVRGFPSKVPSLSSSPWKKFNLVSSRVKFKATAQNFCSALKYSPVQSSILLS